MNKSAGKLTPCDRNAVAFALCMRFPSHFFVTKRYTSGFAPFPIACMPALLETLLAVLLCIGIAFLPPWLVALIWMGALGAFALSFAIERRGHGRAPHFPRALSGLMPLSLAASLAAWAWPVIGPWLALLLAVCALLLGLILHSRVFGWMLRPASELAARYPFTSEHALSGPGGHVWSRLPGSGLRFRMVPGAKPRSSQPQGCTWVFEDGHLLEGRDRSLHVSRDGRWVVVRSLRNGGVLALDRQASRRYVWDDGAELWSSIEGSERWPKTIEQWRKQADTDEPLQLRFGLWLSQEECLRVAPEQIDIPDPQGRPRLAFVAQRAPSRVAEALNPLSYALQPRYEVRFDRDRLPFTVAGPESAVWRADGRALLLVPDDGAGAWLHEDGAPARRIPLRWDAAHGHSALTLGCVRVLDHHRIGIELRQAQPASIYPQCWDAAGIDVGQRIGGTVSWAQPMPDGAASYVEAVLPGESLLWLPLDDLTDSESRAEVESLGPGGHVAVFQRQADRCWRCRLDGEVLPFSPLALAHLWSNDGRHLVLQAAAADGAAFEACLVVDTESRALLAGTARGFDLRPVAMRDGVLQVRRVLGRVQTPGGLLQREPPATARGIAFLQPRRNSWLRFGCDRYEVSPDGQSLLGPQPRHVRVRVAPSPLAMFDLVYPGPMGNWVYLEAARGRYDDAGPRPQDARFAAVACTRSGLACAGLSPAMVWSADGRWLLLVHAPDSNLPTWTPWLLDTENELLYRPHADEPGASALPGMPFFLGFHAGVVRYEWCEHPWWTAGAPRRSGVIPLDSLLARYAKLSLVEAAGLRVPPEQAAAYDWRALARRAARAGG